MYDFLVDFTIGIGVFESVAVNRVESVLDVTRQVAEFHVAQHDGEHELGAAQCHPELVLAEFRDAVLRIDDCYQRRASSNRVTDCSGEVLASKDAVFVNPAPDSGRV